MGSLSRGTTSERFAYIARNQQRYGVGFLCKKLNVSRSGFYAWRARKPCQRRLDDQKLLKRISALYKKSSERYGSPKVFKALKRQGICISRKRVERLMRENQLMARVARVYRRKPLPNGPATLFLTFARISPSLRL